MEKSWFELIATGPSPRTDEASIELISAGSAGVIDVSAGDVSSLKAYLAGGTGMDERVRLLSKSLKGIGWSVSASPYRDSDWTEKWKEGLRPVRVMSPRSPVSLMVLASWQMRAERGGELVIEIDPGMAFGTGSHPTTKMCLKALLRVSAEGSVIVSFLDIGTGSGILAIAAKKLGCKRAVGTDIDPDALEAAVDNARINRVRVTFTDKTPEDVKGLFHVVAANILSGTLIELSNEISAKVKPGGLLILSGILREEASSVARVYKALGFTEERRLSGKGGGGEWAALIMKRCC